MSESLRLKVSQEHQPEPHWVWAPAGMGTLKLERIVFRLDLTLVTAVDTACLMLSARTRYRLKVNGAILGSGPARCYPEFREADTHDLKPYLVPGANQIEVEVLHQTAATFHHLPEPPGFIAWGASVETNGTRHSLITPGRWQCRRRAGVNPETPPLSFAQGAIEVVDLHADTRELDHLWTTPLPGDPGLTPLLRPRTLPALTRHALAAREIRHSAVNVAETVVGAWVIADHSETTGGQMAAAKTWVHSPVAQTVHVAAWWGDYWVNGHLQAKENDPARSLRQTMAVDLKAGWNRLCAAGPIVFGYWEFCLAWPTASRLSVRTSKAAGSPSGVELAGPFPNTTWESCRDDLVKGEPVETVKWRWQLLTHRTCPPLRKLAWATPVEMVTPDSLPLELPAGQHTLITADMGIMTLGPIVLDIEGPAGTTVAIGHSEQAAASGRPDYAKTLTLYGADHFVLPGGRQRIETFSPHGLRHFELLVSQHQAPVVLHGAGVVETRYPYDFTGSFECSDPDFNRLWAFGRRTLELCSEDVLTDCPWRERTLYGGDLLATMGATIGVTHDLRLVRQSIELFLQSFNPATNWLQSMAPMGRDRAPLSEYPLLIAIATAWYLRLTGDRAFAQRAWPVFRAMTRAIDAMGRPDGLYAPPWPAFIDHGRTVCAGPTAPFNAALVAALRAFAETARQAGDEAGAGPLDRRAGDLEALLSKSYFDTGSGSFRDLPLHEGGRETEGCPAIVWPLLFSPATRVLASAALPALKSLLEGFAPDRESQSVSPYQMFYVLALLRQLGEAKLAEETIRRVYAPMLAHPTGTLWEHAQPDQSLTHAWSCGIMDYFSTAVLGVRMGFEQADELQTILISPCAATLDWAKGRVPHPRGEVSVEWKRSGDRLAISVKAPAGVPVTVRAAGPLAKLKVVLF